MPRGFQIKSATDRGQACSNCGKMRFLRYQEMDLNSGRTGKYFCVEEYKLTGEFEHQPWDWTCIDFGQRVRITGKGADVMADAVPVVEGSVP